MLAQFKAMELPVAVALGCAAILLSRRALSKSCKAPVTKNIPASIFSKKKSGSKRMSRKARKGARLRKEKKDNGGAINTAKQSQAHDGFNFKTIGFVKSCFPDRRGTPRQGFFTPSTRATLTLRRGLAPYALPLTHTHTHSNLSKRRLSYWLNHLKEIRPPFTRYALEGIQAYTHVWVTFVFHANTVSKKVAKHGKKQQGNHSRRLKIQPPKHDKRVGVLSTRSPHRPNPIGQTVVRVEAVDLPKGQLHLTGVDFVDGTPVLDIKPYVPFYDCIPEATVPRWVSSADDQRVVKVWLNCFESRMSLCLSCSIGQVRWSEHAMSLMDTIILPTMHFYHSAAEVIQVISEILQQNIRSGAARSRRRGKGKVDNVCSVFALYFL